MKSNLEQDNNLPVIKKIATNATKEERENIQGRTRKIK